MKQILVFSLIILEINTIVSVTHNFDFANKMPDHFMVMFSMSWFGIPNSDSQGAGPDRSYGNWVWGGKCVPTNNPNQCNKDVTASEQRWIASKRRPLAGIYSSSARDEESIARVDLMLSTLRRPCDSGARIDVWCVQIDSLRDTSLHPSNPFSETADLAYHALLGFLNESERANMTNAVMAGIDSTWYFHFGDDVGLGKCDNSDNKQKCITALQNDLIEMIQIANQYKSSVKINGKPIVLIYLDAQYLTPQQWSIILTNVRNSLNLDFYTIACVENPSYFLAFDAIAPWLNLGQWNESSGSSLYDHAYNWVKLEHEKLFNEVNQYPGRVVFGGITPGFDDYTLDWGQCKPRTISRDLDVLKGEFGFLKSMDIKGGILETWDDWTEGSHIEPDVVDGPSVLLTVRQLIGDLFNEPSDPNGDAALMKRWNSYGQARNCNGGHHGIPPVIDLKC